MSRQTLKALDKSEWIRRALERFEGPLTRYASRLLADVERARDVVQDTFLKLCKEDAAQVGDHLPEWLFTVCRNRALDILRKERKMNLVTSLDLEARASRDPGPQRLLEVKEGLSRVSQVLSKLSANQQEVVRLKFQNGMSYQEISGVTGLSVGNVGFQLHTALKAIRRELQVEAVGVTQIRRIQ